MKEKINIDSNPLPMYYMEYSLLDLKKWVDRQIELGYKTCELEYEWGYYDDLDSVELKAKK